MPIRSSRFRSAPFFLLSISGALLLAACNEISLPPPVVPPPPVATTQVSGTVSMARAGEAVAGATISAEGTTATTTTDASGHYALTVPVTTKNLLIAKANYASTRVENIDASAPLVLDEILRPSFDPDLPATPPTVTVARQTQDDKGKVTSSVPFVDGATIDVSSATSPSLFLEVKTTTASPDLNGPATGIASIGAEAGSSGYLNAGRTRVLLSALKSTDLFTFKASDFASFSGKVDIHINIYDHNGNRTHLIRHVTVTNSAANSAVVAPTDLAPLAITFADTATYGALSVQPQTGAAFQQWAKSGSTAALKDLASQIKSEQMNRPQGLTPQSAAPGTVLWVDVSFKYDPAAPAPRSFELYRSFDGATYSKVLTATPTKVLVDPKKPGVFVMRDNSAQLTPGVKTTYLVRAVSDSATKDSAVTTVTPLGRYDVQLGGPAQGATGVETKPVFRWKTTGASDKELLALLLLDRNQAEGKTAQWQSDVTGKTSAVYNFDGAALTPYLQPFHAYDWQMAAVTYNTDETAFSVGADFFNVFGITANPVEGGPINEFVTGGY